MRTLGALLLLLAACRTQPLDHPISDDSGVMGNPVDMAGQRPIDLAVMNGTSCSTLNDCINNCRDANCQNDCYNAGSTDAQSMYTDAVNCIYDFCLQPQDTRPARCVTDDNGNFVDAADGGAGRCNKCLGNAFASLGGYQCQPKNDPDCNPASCQGSVNLCKSN